MSTTYTSDFTMADIQPSMTSDFLQAPFDFDAFGFSPATSPARGQKGQEFNGYFSNAMNDATSFMDQNENDFFNSGYAQPSQLPSDNSMAGFSSINAKVVNGQVTPPSDNSPVSPKQEMHSEPPPVSLDEVITKPQTTRKKRTSQVSQASTQDAPTKRRKSSARKASMDSQEGGETDEKRSKFLERNRVAASKCRQKKKEWTSNLEQRARDLQQNKANLTLLVNSLRDEVLYLKGEVLKHDNCNCTALRSYMSRSVSQLSGDPPLSGKLQLPTGATPISDLDLDGMSFAGSPQVSASTGSPMVKAGSPS